MGPVSDRGKESVVSTGPVTLPPSDGRPRVESDVDDEEDRLDDEVEEYLDDLERHHQSQCGPSSSSTPVRRVVVETLGRRPSPSDPNPNLR